MRVPNYGFNKSHLRPLPAKRTPPSSPGHQCSHKGWLTNPSDLDLSESPQIELRAVIYSLLQVNNIAGITKAAEMIYWPFLKSRLQAVLLDTDQLVLGKFLHTVFSHCSYDCNAMFYNLGSSFFRCGQIMTIPV